MLIILLSFILHLIYLFLQSFENGKQTTRMCDAYGTPSRQTDINVTNKDADVSATSSKSRSSGNQ